jgi:NAD(P)-dependent dehydrogenase (short-subunit alcohol dehydrogenase family)
MGDLDGTTYLVTGANSGIGKAVARELAARGGRVFLAGRSESKTRAAIKEIIDRTGNTALHFLPLDLGSLSSVRACAEAFLANGEPLHALVNNAGVAGKRGVTDSGFELTFGTNYVGPFLLTNLLLERLRQSGPARIVNVASDAHFSAKGIDFEAVRRPTRSRAPRARAGAAAGRPRNHHVFTASRRHRHEHLARDTLADPAVDEAPDALAR